MREIAANKVCALLGRGEIRDLTDLRALLARGLDLPSVLADAERKDCGVAAGLHSMIDTSRATTLAWILSGIHIDADTPLPGVTATDLDAFRRDLVVGLRALAKPPHG